MKPLRDTFIDCLALSATKPNKGSSGNPQWSWKDICPRPAGSDSESVLFRLRYLDDLHEVFLLKKYEENGLVPLNSLDTENRTLRVYYIGMENLGPDVHIFIRNENDKGVFNWSIGCTSPFCPVPGDFADFPAKAYQPDYGGFLADIFTIWDKSLFSGGFGTNVFANYTTANTLVYSVAGSSLFYIELRLVNIARCALALQMGKFEKSKFLPPNAPCPPQ